MSVSRLASTPADYLDWAEVTTPGPDALDHHRRDFGHPLWILFSSGTTGLPKGIIHGHGGVLVEHLESRCPAERYRTR